MFRKSSSIWGLSRLNSLNRFDLLFVKKQDRCSYRSKRNYLSSIKGREKGKIYLLMLVLSSVKKTTVWLCALDASKTRTNIQQRQFEMSFREISD